MPTNSTYVKKLLKGIVKDDEKTLRSGMEIKDPLSRWKEPEDNKKC